MAVTFLLKASKVIGFSNYAYIVSFRGGALCSFGASAGTLGLLPSC